MSSACAWEVPPGPLIATAWGRYKIVVGCGRFFLRMTREMGLAIEVPSLPLTARAEGWRRITFSPLGNTKFASRSLVASTFTGASVVVVVGAVVVYLIGSAGRYIELGFEKYLGG